MLKQRRVIKDRRRFFRNFELDYEAIAKVVVALVNIPQPWVLSTDRTEWSFETKRFNILFLGVVHDGIGYPIVWTILLIEPMIQFRLKIRESDAARWAGSPT